MPLGWHFGDLVHFLVVLCTVQHLVLAKVPHKVLIGIPTEAGALPGWRPGSQT